MLWARLVNVNIGRLAIVDVCGCEKFYPMCN